MNERQVYTHANLTTMTGSSGYGLINEACLAIDGPRIAFAGPMNELPETFRSVEPLSLEGRLVTPGLIDCHTHVVHAGSRATEFEQRLSGASYEDIARAGGGIMSTVSATRTASETELLNVSLSRIDQMLATGTTTLEIKSGYGLDSETELKMLLVARQIAEERPVSVLTTFLGAHAIPDGMAADTYIDEVCIPALLQAAEADLVDAVDGFCETIAFTPTQIERVFQTAQPLNLPVKLHAEQLSDQNGAALAARYQALSADHLEYLNQNGITAMAKAGTIAVLLPGAFYYLGETKLPPIDGLKAAGVPIAIATDCNPGSSPMTSLPLAMNMAATLFGLTPEDCLRGVTINAAMSLGLSDRGQIMAGQRADLAIWEAGHPAELTYRIGDTPLYQRIIGGQPC